MSCRCSGGPTLEAACAAAAATSCPLVVIWTPALAAVEATLAAAAVAKAMATGEPDPMLVLLLLLPVLPMLKRLAGQPYLDLLRWRSMSQRRLKALPQEGHRCVPRCMCLWCWSEPGCLKILPHSSQVYRPMPSGATEKALATESERRNEMSTKPLNIRTVKLWRQNLGNHEARI